MIKKIVNLPSAKLTLVMTIILILVWFVQPYISDLMGPEGASNKLKGNTNLNQQHPGSSGTTDANPVPLGTDPFKAFIEKKGTGQKPVEVNASTDQKNITSPAADPFKAFLERQQKEATVSPFGK